MTRREITDTIRAIETLLRLVERETGREVQVGRFNGEVTVYDP